MVSCAYYAAIYSILALLRTIGKVPKKHSGAIALFNSEFVKPGEPPKELSVIIERLFKSRMQDDYERLAPVGMPDADAALKDAELFVERIRSLLAAEGVLKS